MNDSKSQTTTDLTAKLVLLIADTLTTPPDNDRPRQVFNAAAELRRCMAKIGEFAEGETDNAE